MFEFGDKYLYRLRRGMTPVPGLIRMDRALIYIKQRLDRLIQEINDRTTKTLGESASYSIRRFSREVVQICSMSGDAYLAEQVYGMLDSINTRTLRLDAIRVLREVLQKLDQYEPTTDSEDVESLRGRIASLEEQLSEPSQQEGSKLDTSEESSVFVIMPFRPEFNDVWKGGIQRAAQAEGFKPIRVDMINRSTNITDDIVNSIEKCHLAIVDVTDNNPNVMFELGYALAKEKPNIIISQSADYLPFDIRNIRAIVYSNTWSGIEDLKVKVQDFLREFSQKRADSQKKSSSAKKSSTKKAKRTSKQ
jgi:nucleoside 2-deoxyribosyltransferase